MGNDGGVKITPISYIRNDWKKIKYALLADLKNELNTAVSDSFDHECIRDEHPKHISKIKSWPDNVRFKTNDYIHKLLDDSFHSRDCPYIFQGKYIVTAYGNYVTEMMCTLSYHLPGEDIETWT